MSEFTNRNYVRVKANVVCNFETGESKVRSFWADGTAQTTQTQTYSVVRRNGDFANELVLLSRQDVIATKPARMLKRYGELTTDMTKG